MTAADLDALLRRVAQRDADAFAAFYDATRARVYGLVTRVLRDRGYSERDHPGRLSAGVADGGKLTRPPGRRWPGC